MLPKAQKEVSFHLTRERHRLGEKFLEVCARPVVIFDVRRKALHQSLMHEFKAAKFDPVCQWIHVFSFGFVEPRARTGRRAIEIGRVA